MTISQVGSSAANSSLLKSGQSLAGNFDNFLKLLTTQLRQQDPLSPMDTNQFTSQLVQFASVEQATKSNEQLTKLTSLLQASTMTSALGYLGAQVSADGDRLRLPASGDAGVPYSLPAKAATVTITVRNAQGAPVFSAVGEAGQGSHTFRWDGTNATGQRLPAGDYAVTVDAVDADGTAVPVDRAVHGAVDGVENDPDGLYLLVGGVPIPASAVQSVSRAPAA